MSKEQLKIKKLKRERKIITKKELSLLDTHRKIPKVKGGTYEDDNYVIIDPIEHQKEHGNFRERSGDLDLLKMLMDDRLQMMKLRNKVQNQMLAYERRVDLLNEETVNFFDEQLKVYNDKLKCSDKNVKKAITDLIKSGTANGKIAESALGVFGVGHVTIACCLTYIDIEKSRHASSLWSYAGLHKASHERYEKGTSSGGNKTLRTQLYTFADSQIKTRGAYRDVYDNTKNRLSESSNKVKSRNTQGKLIECEWKDTKVGHRHGAALRKVMKNFLADYWYVARTLNGLTTTPVYAESILKGGHRTIMPEERGWIY